MNMPIPSRHLPTPNSQLTTSAKSVFECDLGCFDLHNNSDGEHSLDCPHHPSRSNSSESALTQLHQEDAELLRQQEQAAANSDRASNGGRRYS